MRSPGRHGANAKVARLRTAGPTTEPLTSAHTPHPASAQISVTGSATAAPSISAWDMRSKASRLRKRLSDTTLHAPNGSSKANTGSTSATRGTANQLAIGHAPRERIAQLTIDKVIVIQKQVSISC